MRTIKLQTFTPQAFTQQLRTRRNWIDYTRLAAGNPATQGITGAVLAVCLAAAAAGVATAQQFPDGRPIEMTVMFGAGSAADVTARYLAEGMAKALGVPVPVVNRTGGGGAIGYSHVQQQKPDGHSIIWNSNSISTNYHSGILSFDYKAFDAVARVSVENPVIAVRSDAPWKTLQEFVEYAKANPGKVRIGIPAPAATLILPPRRCS